MVAGVQPDGGMIEPLADSLAQTVLGIGVSGPWLPMMSSVNHVGLTAELRFITSVDAFGSDVLTRLSGRWPGT